MTTVAVNSAVPTAAMIQNENRYDGGFFSNYKFDKISTDEIPWKPSPNTEYSGGIFGLHKEIKDFVNYISPTREENIAREFVIYRVKACIHALWPNVRIEVCGSYKMHLYLPTSDIDLVIFGLWEKDSLPLDALKAQLERSDLSSNIKVLSRATVPIIKMTEKATQINVDISFNMENSIHAVTLISQSMISHPELHALTLVVKQLLYQRELNEVFTGGLSSYGLILMCLSFLQHNVPARLNNINLGVLLIEFLELYGQRFNYNTTGICLANGGVYCKKTDLFKTQSNELLCIQDPLNPENDLGRRTFAMLQVKQAFEYAYLVLSNATFPHYNLKDSNGSILGRVIRIATKTQELRKHIANFVSTMPFSSPPYIATYPTQIYISNHAFLQSMINQSAVIATAASNATTNNNNSSSAAAVASSDSDVNGKIVNENNEEKSAPLSNKVNNEIAPNALPAGTILHTTVSFMPYTIWQPYPASYQCIAGVAAPIHGTMRETQVLQHPQRIQSSSSLTTYSPSTSTKSSALTSEESSPEEHYLSRLEMKDRPNKTPAADKRRVVRKDQQSILESISLADPGVAKAAAHDNRVQLMNCNSNNNNTTTCNNNTNHSNNNNTSSSSSSRNSFKNKINKNNAFNNINNNYNDNNSLRSSSEENQPVVINTVSSHNNTNNNPAGNQANFKRKRLQSNKKIKSKK